MVKLPVDLDVLRCSFHHTCAMDFGGFVSWAKSKIGQTQDCVHKRSVQCGELSSKLMVCG